MSEQQINQIMEKLGHIQGTMEGMEKRMDEICGYDGRIATLERWQANITGKIAAYSALGAVVMSVVYMVIKELLSKYV